MKQAYQSFDFRADTIKLIAYIDGMITDYVRQGFRLSVRQLYYQLVARGMVENTERSYKRAADIISKGRLAGLLDWDAIEDRGRDVVIRSRWGSGADIVDAAASSFHMDMWENQANRVFIVVEKAALAGVLEGVSHAYDVPLLAARGYPSVSILREMALENLAPAIEQSQTVTLLHLGDHDPSGIDMTRDLSERFDLFLDGRDIDLQRIALNMEQVEEKNPPPNPAKTTDSRFADYQRKFGSESWELDALEPRYLVQLVTERITALIDGDAWDERQEEIDTIRAKLKRTAAAYRKADKT